MRTNSLKKHYKKCLESSNENLQVDNVVSYCQCVSNSPAFIRNVLCSLLALNDLANWCDSSKQSTKSSSWGELRNGYIPAPIADSLTELSRRSRDISPDCNKNRGINCCTSVWSQWLKWQPRVPTEYVQYLFANCTCMCCVTCNASQQDANEDVPSVTKQIYRNSLRLQKLYVVQ